MTAKLSPNQIEHLKRGADGNEFWYPNIAANKRTSKSLRNRGLLNWIDVSHVRHEASDQLTAAGLEVLAELEQPMTANREPYTNEDELREDRQFGDAWDAIEDQEYIEFEDDDTEEFTADDLEWFNAIYEAARNDQ